MHILRHCLMSQKRTMMIQKWNWMKRRMITMTMRVVTVMLKMKKRRKRKRRKRLKGENSRTGLTHPMMT
uniref:Uncharacterized protein n=1 Tax=Arundo donax TaxID=35708 RepID=A0A0A9EST5_ARUDO